MATSSEERRIRRAARDVQHATPAPPVLAASLYCDVVGEDGVAGRYIFSGGGRVVGAGVYVEGLPQRGEAELQVEAVQPDGSTHTIPVTVTKKNMQVELDLEVKAGTRLTIFAAPGLTGIWIGLLWKLGSGR